MRGIAFIVGLVLAATTMACSGGGGGGGDSCSKCAGCCQNGICETGLDSWACGSGGKTCDACVAGEECKEAACVASTTSCGPGNNPNGCCVGSTPKPGTENAACGTGGADCQDCTAGTACSNHACTTIPNSCTAATCAGGCCDAGGCETTLTNDHCGVGGVQCSACTGSQTCNASTGQCECAPNCSGKDCGAEDGCNGTCKNGTCATAGFTCVDGTCKAGSTDIWIVTVASGIITEKNAAGESWDPLGGLPDPFACLTIGGQAQACTPAVQDTLTPAWNFQLGAATTAAIQAGIAVEIWDEDELSNDPICAALAIVPTDDGLAAGSMDVGCAQGTVTLLFTRSN